jgi:transposase-like protein
MHYSAAFKKEAVRLIVLDGLSASDVGKRLGVNPGQMYKWKQVHLSDLEKDAQAKSQASPKEMSAEIDRLRKELARSERINQILKKTVGYFAKDEQ